MGHMAMADSARHGFEFVQEARVPSRTSSLFIDERKPVQRADERRRCGG